MGGSSGWSWGVVAGEVEAVGPDTILTNDLGNQPPTLFSSPYHHWSWENTWKDKFSIFGKWCQLNNYQWIRESNIVRAEWDQYKELTHLLLPDSDAICLVEWQMVPLFGSPWEHGHCLTQYFLLACPSCHHTNTFLWDVPGKWYSDSVLFVVLD